MVGDFYDGTPAAAASDAVSSIDTDIAPVQVEGDRLTVTAAGLTVPEVRTQRGRPARSSPPGAAVSS